jgi:TonB family protein
MFSNCHLKNKIAWSCVLRISVVFLLASASIPHARAQQPQIDALAARVAEELRKKHEKTVIVFDFVGPDKKSTAFGQKIADDFSDALKKSGPTLSVIDRTQIAQGLKADRLASVYDTEMNLRLAKELKAAAMVLGTIELHDENLKIAVDSYRVTDGKTIKEFKVKVPLTEQMKSLIDTHPDAGENQSATLPSGGANGYSLPACIYCPQAQYSAQGAKSHIEGTVILVAIVGPDGQAHDIRVVTALPDGLTEKAIEAVRSWKFKPAKGPDGTPAAVRQTIEVSFHLYDQPH